MAELFFCEKGKNCQIFVFGFQYISKNIEG
jgi:hypothetical protein